ncbi:hypothetical protein FRX31_026771 [Thalictrum thalictroides]|uniref:Uncharacterized protein n=1 Tax=Thalictrum thalictroides TaxID=46969 RepID=A0A7J6VH75_THATH|nr:hypothetical protein FRX31_026771 [Thalictrum thalictroides]
MQILVIKQKILKHRLKDWAKVNCSKLHEKVLLALQQLEEIQRQLQTTPADISLSRLEKQALKKYCNLAAAEHNQLRQQSSCDWLTMGDRSTTYFHHAVRERKCRKAIRTLEDQMGNKLDNEAAIISEITGYFRNLFGEEDMAVEADIIRSLTFSEYITEEEVWDHIRSYRMWMSVMKACSKRSVLANIASSMTCATVRYIWQERNARRFQGKSKSANNLKLRLVKEMARYLQMKLKQIPDIPSLRGLCDRLGIVNEVKL